jgi:hypothetical protein
MLYLTQCPMQHSYISHCWQHGRGRRWEKISTGQGHIFLTMSATKEYIPTG